MFDFVILKNKLLITFRDDSFFLFLANGTGDFS